MVIEAARISANEILKPRFRNVVWKSLGLTILLFFGMWVGLEMLVSTYLFPILAGWPWVTTAILWLLGAGVVVGAGFLLAPTTAVFAGLFLDEIAEHVEDTHYPHQPQGKPLNVTSSVWLTIKFTTLVILTNLVALLLVIFFGMGILIFFLVNGYLLGREYFQFAAMRYRSEAEANQLRQKHRFEIFMAGLVIAAVISIPILNLFTPVFAASMMVHIHKSLSADDQTADFGREVEAA